MFQPNGPRPFDGRDLATASGCDRYLRQSASSAGNLGGRVGFVISSCLCVFVVVMGWAASVCRLCVLCASCGFPWAGGWAFRIPNSEFRILLQHHPHEFLGRWAKPLQRLFQSVVYVLEHEVLVLRDAAAHVEEVGDVVRKKGRRPFEAFHQEAGLAQRLVRTQERQVAVFPSFVPVGTRGPVRMSAGG